MTKAQAIKKYGSIYKILDVIEYEVDNMMVVLVRNKYLRKSARNRFKKDMKKVFKQMNDLYLYLAKK